MSTLSITNITPDCHNCHCMYRLGHHAHLITGQMVYLIRDALTDSETGGQRQSVTCCLQSPRMV